MLEEGLNFLKQLHEQPEKVLPILYNHKQTINEVLPFYIALFAKTSSDPDKFMAYAMSSLDKIYGSDKTGKSPKEQEISDYAYHMRAKAAAIFDKLDKF